MSRRTERSHKVDGTDKLARHSAVRCSVPEINDPVVQREFTFLLREACGPSPSATAGAAVSKHYRKQWKRARTRRRNLIRLGIHPAEVYKATRSHRGYWWMAGTSIVQRALDNRWLTERGVPSLRQQWIEMHYGRRNEKFNPEAANLTGIAGCGPACPVVWEAGG